MLLLIATTDKLQLVTSVAATIDVHASFVDATQTAPPVIQGDTSGRKNTAITTATTTDIVAAPASGETRNVKTLHVCNTHASLSCDVTVIFNENATLIRLFKATLDPGESLEYVEGIGFFTVENVAKLDVMLRVAADVTNATTSFADVTGLTYPVLAGKAYKFLAHLIHINNATTTGSRFAVNGPTMTNVIAATIDTVTASVTASVHSAGAVSALETAITAQTTGSVANTLAIISGIIEPSANGTFAIRCASEVAVASGLIVRRGSWCHLRECDN